MTQSIGPSDSGGVNGFSVTVPSAGDAADIVKAFSVYHYGSETPPTSLTSIQSKTGVAGWLKQLQGDISNLQVSNATPTEWASTPAKDLNTITDNGLYYIKPGVSTSGWSNLPTYIDYSQAVNTLPAAVAVTFGYLQVTKFNNDTAVYQTFRTLTQSTPSQTGGTLVSTNTTFQRVGYIVSGTRYWSTWKQISDADHLYDYRYYTKSSVDTLINTATVFTSGKDAVVVTDATSGAIKASGITATKLGYLTDVTSNIQSQLTGKASSTLSGVLTSDAVTNIKMPTMYTTGTTGAAGALTANRIFVQSTTPTATAVGDLWFW